ncbi:hypothetical protein M426DRAFT_252350 [Hypoxylon sp. CI-4A]|nr:hypothetical protein M426DRAFT_252350 [Hypoxylon sp. CI-4A]
MAIANHMNIANDAHDARNALATPPSDPGQNTGDDSILWNGSPTPSCSCMQDAVRVIQQLDDDEFGITSLSLDQVLQLQKWMIAQCCKPIDCVNCVHLSAIHTVLLIIADRLTETFECLHRRIRRAAAGLSDHQSSLPNALTPSEIDEPTFPVDTRAQLFCNSSGIAASSSMCNNQLFSAEFRAQYSDEEQVHMIRVLLKLQIRNFRNLLSRIDSVNQITGSSARRSKIRALVGRLGKSNTDIEVALQAVLRTISGP